MTAALPIAVTAEHFSPAIAVDELQPSATNPRKTFDPQRLAEMAKTIAEHGILEPILARPLPGKLDHEHAKAGVVASARPKFEIVAGERRWRAAKLAKLATVPVIVRPLNDKQALEIQTIENAQREDLHPLEQAEGYERLIKEFGYTPEKIADAIGKSRAHVFQIRKLGALSAKLRSAFIAGEMDTTLATVLARVPGNSLQDAAWQKLKDEFPYGFSFRVAAEFIRKNFMLDLMRAPFNINDESLVVAAGACGKCPKRTGNQTDLFPDVKNGNVCTDPVCFSAKRKAAQAKEVKTLESKGVTVLTGDAARRILPNDWSRLGSHTGYAQASEHCHEDPKGRTYGQLAKAANLEPVKIQNPHDGAMLDAVPVAALKLALKETSITLGGSRMVAGGDDSWRAKQRAIERWHRLESAIRRKIFEKTLEHTKGKLGKPELIAIAIGYYTDIWHEFRKRIAQAWKWDGIAHNGNALRKKLAALSEADLGRFLISLSLVKGSQPNHSGYAELLAAAKRAGIKPDAIRRELAEQAKASLKAKGKPNPLSPAQKIPVGVVAFVPSRGLAAIVGPHRITRDEALKRVLFYVNGAGLTDKKKKAINLDAKLKTALAKRLPRILTLELREMVNAQLKLVPSRAALKAKATVEESVRKIKRHFARTEAGARARKAVAKKGRK